MDNLHVRNTCIELNYIMVRKLVINSAV